MFLMFSLRRPNVLPTGDYGVQVAIKKHYKKRKLPKAERYGEDRPGVGAVSQRGLLVHVAESGHQDGLTKTAHTRLPL